jgi:mannose-6-phosphate isomerase-like protein (cupin superfamily)
MSFKLHPVTLHAGEGQRVGMPGHPFVIKARSEETGGAYALVEATLTGGGPPEHIHHAEDEAFYVLEGRVNIQVGHQTIAAEPGSFVLIPRGTAHTFWNAGPTPAKFLVIVSPPGVEEDLAEVIGEEEIDTASFVERITALADSYRVEIIGPPRG